jgi:hypothetical protein
MHVTNIAQRWVDLRGKWSPSEKEKDGDEGRLAEDAKAKEFLRRSARAIRRGDRCASE